MKGILLAPLLGTLCGVIAWIATPAHPVFAASPTPSASPSAAPSPGLSSTTSVLGQTFGVAYTPTTNADQTGLNTTLSATILGKQKSLAQVSVASNSTFDEAEFTSYVAGVQVASTQASIIQGGWSYDFTLPPVNISATVLTYPIGPIILQVDAGFSLAASIDPGIQLAIAEGPSTTPSSIQATLGGSIAAAGFVQGSVDLIAVRGGIEGQIDVAEGSVTAGATLYLGKQPPNFTITGALGFFGGKVSAVADYFDLLGWVQFWSATLFQWNGWCIDFNNGVTVGGTCPVAP